MRALLRLLLQLALVACVAGVLAGCGGGGPAGTAPVTLQSLHGAAQKTAGAATGRFAFSLELSAPGAPEPLVLRGEGAFDTPADRVALSLDLSSFAELLGGLAGALGGKTADLGNADDWRLDAVQDGPVLYMRFPLAASELPAGASWVQADLREAGAPQGVDLDQLRQLAGASPGELLEYLDAVSGSLERVGREEVRGVATTRYRARIDLGAYERLVPPAERERLGSLLDSLVAESGLREIPVEVWVADDLLVRRLAIAVSAAQPGSGERVEARMRYELFDYGKPVEIEPPPPGDVVEASALGR
jgi:hypothetical protein